tara:strand:+ start:142 stop:543 length:402 start_codon:yes stop_codon:yes gene_type:complete
MKITREIESLENSINSLINFFEEIKNYEKIFDEDIASFEVLNENTFRLKIGSFPNISLTHKKTSNNSFSLKSRSDNFDFEIHINLYEINMSSTKCQIIFNGNFSSMIEMIAKKPLENFLTNISKKIEDLELSN